MTRPKQAEPDPIEVFTAAEEGVLHHRMLTLPDRRIEPGEEVSIEELEEALREYRAAKASWAQAPAPVKQVKPVRTMRPLSSILARRNRPAAMSRTRAQPKVKPYPPSTEGEARFQQGKLGCWQSAIVISDDGGSTINVRVGNRPVLVERHKFRPPRKIGDPPPLHIEPIGDFSPGAKGKELPPIGRPVVRSASSVLVKTQRGAMKPQPKPRGRIRDGDYLRYIRQQACCSCQTVATPRDAHHFGLPIGDVRGVGQKVDDLRTVPLCRRCHDHWHRTRQLLGQPGCKEWAEVYLYRVQIDLLIAYFVLAMVDREAEELLERELDEPGFSEAGRGEGP